MTSTLTLTVFNFFLYFNINFDFNFNFFQLFFILTSNITLYTPQYAGISFFNRPQTGPVLFFSTKCGDKKVEWQAGAELGQAQVKLEVVDEVLTKA